MANNTVMELKNWTNQERGRSASLARAVGVSQPTMARWVNGLDQIPESRCRDIERATNGEVTCEELRPDLAAEFAYMRQRAVPNAAVASTGIANTATEFVAK